MTLGRQAETSQNAGSADFCRAADPQSKASSQMAIDIGHVCLR
jgi:hypothetical protein